MLLKGKGNRRITVVVNSLRVKLSKCCKAVIMWRNAFFFNKNSFGFSLGSFTFENKSSQFFGVRSDIMDFSGH